MSGTTPSQSGLGLERLEKSGPARSVGGLLAPLEALAARSDYLVAGGGTTFLFAGCAYEVPRYIFMGPRGGGDPVRVGLFAGVHGDEPEGVYALVRFLQLLERSPELATGYCLLVYPVCNPTGFEAGTRLSGAGLDLNREFWLRSDQPEVRYLEAELRGQSLQGLISLHTDDTSDGLYGFVHGSTLTQHLLLPALEAAEAVLPRNRRETIDGFPARNGLIRDRYPGVLSAPPEARPRPFEIILETPQVAPELHKSQALVIALQTILAEYRKLIAFAPNL